MGRGGGGGWNILPDNQGFRKNGGINWELEEGFLSNGLVFLSPDNKYPMQPNMGGYETNINSIQSLPGRDIQQARMYSMGMLQITYLILLLCFSLTINLLIFCL